MKYIEDKDLNFLKNLESSDLNNLVKILTDTKTEELTKRDIYKEFYPEHNYYWEEIASELQYFGGNTIVNVFRQKGVLYAEILEDVCKTLGVKIEKNLLIEDIERKLLEVDKKEGIIENIKKQIKNIDAKDGLLIASRFTPLTLPSLPLLLVKKLSDPAYRITTEAVFEIANLRKKYTSFSKDIICKNSEERNLVLKYSDSLVIKDEENNSNIVEIKVIEDDSLSQLDFEQDNNTEIGGIKHLISDIVKGVIGTSNQTVELVFSAEVQKGLVNGTYKLLEDRAIAVSSTGGKIKEHGMIFQSGQAKQFLTGGYQLLSIAVAQSHLADIEKRLYRIEYILNDIKQNFENDDISKIIGDIKYLTNEAKEQSHLTNEKKIIIESIKKDIFQWKEKLSLEIIDCLRKIKNMRNKDTIGSENTYKEILNIMKEDMNKFKYKYELLSELHILLTILDNFINPLESGFKKINLNLEEISTKIKEIYPLLETKKELLKSIFNQNDTLEERKKVLNLLQDNYKNNFESLTLNYQKKHEYVSNKFSKVNYNEISIIVSLDENSEIKKYLIKESK